MLRHKGQNPAYRYIAINLTLTQAAQAPAFINPNHTLCQQY